MCGECGAFDSLSWSAPQVQSLEMLPGAARDERLASDAASSFLHRPAELEDAETAWARPKAARKEEVGESERGFVVLPRPPDDPGPEGHEFEPDAPASNGGF